MRSCSLLFRGGINNVEVNLRKIVEQVINTNATSVILAHNHPSGVAIPSTEDRVVTEQVAAVLDSLNVRLYDHIIVAGADCLSMAENGDFPGGR